MEKKRRETAMFVVGWEIEVATDKSGEERIGFTFKGLKGVSVNVILHPKEAMRFRDGLLKELPLLPSRH